MADPAAESTDIPEEPGSVPPSVVQEPPAKVVELEVVPPPVIDVQAREVNTEDTVAHPPKPPTPPATEKPKTPSTEATEKPKTPLLQTPVAAAAGAEKLTKLASLKKKTTGQTQESLPDINGAAKKSASPATGNAKRPVKPDSAAIKTPSPSLPPIKQKSKIPSASPTRVNRPSPGRSRIPAVAPGEREVIGGSAGNAGAGRDVSPGGGWNMFNRENIKPKAQAVISGPSDEERLKRRQWALEKRRRDQAKARAETEREQAVDTQRKEVEEAKLEQRRASIRERIQRQQEIAMRQAQEEAAALERAKQEMSRYLGDKPLYEKMEEEYIHQVKEEEVESWKRYEEQVGRYKMARPHQIIAGEIIVKPPPVEEKPRDISASRPVRKSPRHEGFSATYLTDNADSGEGSPTQPAASKPRKRGQPPRSQPGATSSSGADSSNGLVLYSRSAKPQSSKLVERAVSPFVYNSEQQPINVPDQATFWQSRKPDVLMVEAGEPMRMTAVEEGDAPMLESPSGIDPGSLLPADVDVEQGEEATVADEAEPQAAPEPEAEPEPEPEAEAEASELEVPGLPEGADMEPAVEAEAEAVKPEAAEEQVEALHAEAVPEPVAAEAEPEPAANGAEAGEEGKPIA